MESGLQKKIRGFLGSTGLSVSALERKAGLKTNVARNILRGQSKKPTAETLQAIASVMGCSVSDLLGVQKTTINVKEDTSPAIEYPELLKELLNTILEATGKNNQLLTLEKFLLILKETYTYSLQKHPPQIDQNFVEWFVKRTLS